VLWSLVYSLVGIVQPSTVSAFCSRQKSKTTGDVPRRSDCQGQRQTWLPKWTRLSDYASWSQFTERLTVCFSEQLVTSFASNKFQVLAQRAVDFLRDCALAEDFGLLRPRARRIRLILDPAFPFVTHTIRKPQPTSLN
jgi:hypothetical protein